MPLSELYDNYNGEQLLNIAHESRNRQAPQRSIADPSNYYIEESNYERSPSIVEENESTVYEVYPESLEDSEFASRRSYQTSGNIL